MSGRDVVGPEHDEALDKLLAPQLAKLDRLGQLSQDDRRAAQGEVDRRRMPNGRAVVPLTSAVALDLEDDMPEPARQLPPLPLACFPPALADLADHMAGIWDVDPALYVLPGLAVLSVAVGNSTRLLLPGGDFASAALWLAVIARTGSGKTPAARVIAAPLERTQCELDGDYLERLDQWDKLPKAAKETQPRPVPRQVVVTDSTWERIVGSLHHNPGGLLWRRDEVAGIFKQLGAYHNKGGDYAGEDLLSTWSQEDFRRQRVKDAEYTIVKKPFLTVSGGIQPKKLPELGNNDAGRLARMLVYATNRDPSLEEVVDPKPTVLARWAELVTELVTRRLYADTTTAEITLSPSARLLWKDKQRQKGLAIREADDDARAFLAKLDQHAARLAVIHHACTHVRDREVEVHADSLEFGWEIASVFLQHQLAAFSPVVSDFIVRPEARAEQQAVMQLDQWVQQREGRGRRREAQQAKVGGARNPADFGLLVRRWEEMGLGHTETEASAQGRPATWLVKGVQR